MQECAAVPHQERLVQAGHRQQEDLDELALLQRSASSHQALCDQRTSSAALSWDLSGLALLQRGASSCEALCDQNTSSSALSWGLDELALLQRGASPRRALQLGPR